MRRVAGRIEDVDQEVARFLPQVCTSNAGKVLNAQDARVLTEQAKVGSGYSPPQVRIAKGNQIIAPGFACTRAAYSPLLFKKAVPSRTLASVGVFSSRDFWSMLVAGLGGRPNPARGYLRRTLRVTTMVTVTLLNRSDTNSWIID
jgi:hypothetical protein